MTRIEHAECLRACTEIHYNCCQAALLPFSSECGLEEAQSLAISAQFGGGMRIGSVCGAATGALMALGLMGKSDADSRAFMQRFRAEAGALECAALLKAAHDMGEERKQHCDRMVYLAIKLAEEL